MVKNCRFLKIKKIVNGNIYIVKVVKVEIKKKCYETVDLVKIFIIADLHIRDAGTGGGKRATGSPNIWQIG